MTGQIVTHPPKRIPEMTISFIDAEIPLTPPVVDKKQQFSVIAEYSLYVLKSSHKEILHWYGFAENYDKRISEIRIINKVKINTAKQQVYQEVKRLLPDISNVNLRQQLSKTKKIYNLFNAIGIEKIECDFENDH
ncbi:3026_t:CDS:2 [Funneliformis geosporum]|nr:3026_t:CDS:2 [Funneliformis geosporum]